MSLTSHLTRYQNMNYRLQKKKKTFTLLLSEHCVGLIVSGFLRSCISHSILSLIILLPHMNRSFLSFVHGLVGSVFEIAVTIVSIFPPGLQEYTNK
jgi:hypothetical protein